MDIHSLEEKQLAAQVKNLAELCEKHYKPYYSDFLNELQISAALEIVSKSGISNYLMWGGYDGSERVMLCVYPDYMCPEMSEFPIECLSLSYRKTDKLTHRDFLGALMSLGIKREVVGDIVVGEGITSFFVKAELASYVRAQIDKIGKVGVVFTEKTVDFESKVQDFDTMSCTVSSLRLDNVVSAALNLSRGKTQGLIESGVVTKNSKLVYDSDSKLASGDKISVRGFGKFIVIYDGEISRKGKYRIVINKFK